MLYGGWGSDEHREKCNVHRVEEVATSLRMLHAINAEGADTAALASRTAGTGKSAGSVLAALRSRLDMDCVTIAGHSYGAGTAAAVGAQVDGVHSSILLDPWYPAIPSAVRSTDWASGRGGCPFLVIGSHAFNRPGPSGALICEGSDNQGLQDAVLGACARAAGHNGSGAVLVVPRDSQHSLVDDLGTRFIDRCATPSCVLRIHYPIRLYEIAYSFCDPP
jgi:pimeloyl-ACP methyl ester carboxylesterase